MTRATHHTHTTRRASSTIAFCGLPTAIDNGMKSSAPTATIVATVALPITRMRRAFMTDADMSDALGHRAVEDLDHVQDRQLGSACAKSGLDLQHAARVRADDGARARRDDRIELPSEEPVRVLGLCEVVGAGAAAAHVRVGHLEQLEAVNTRQEVARLLSDALRVRKMTGVLVRRAQVESAEPRAGHLREVLVHVAHL